MLRFVSAHVRSVLSASLMVIKVESWIIPFQKKENPLVVEFGSLSQETIRFRLRRGEKGRKEAIEETRMCGDGEVRLFPRTTKDNRNQQRKEGED